MIRHIVCWKLTATDAATKAEHAAEIARQMNELPALIPEIRALQVGKNVLFPEVNWDVVLIADFDNQTGDPTFDRALQTALSVGIEQSDVKVTPLALAWLPAT